MSCYIISVFTIHTASLCHVELVLTFTVSLSPEIESACFSDFTLNRNISHFNVILLTGKVQCYSFTFLPAHQVGCFHLEWNQHRKQHGFYIYTCIAFMVTALYPIVVICNHVSSCTRSISMSFRK